MIMPTHINCVMLRFIMVMSVGPIGYTQTHRSSNDRPSLRAKMVLISLISIENQKLNISSYHNIL